MKKPENLELPVKLEHDDDLGGFSFYNKNGDSRSYNQQGDLTDDYQAMKYIRDCANNFEESIEILEKLKPHLNTFIHLTCTGDKRNELCNKNTELLEFLRKIEEL